LAFIEVDFGLELSPVDALERQSEARRVSHRVEQPYKVFRLVVYFLLLLHLLELLDFGTDFLAEVEQGVVVEVSPQEPHLALTQELVHQPQVLEGKGAGDGKSQLRLLLFLLHQGHHQLLGLGRLLPLW